MTDKGKETLVAICFLLPNLIGFLIFTFFPVLASLVLSFFEWNIFSAPQYVGLQNFIQLLGFSIQNGSIEFNDPNFWYYLYNTVFLMLIIPIQVFGSLLAAMALNQDIKGVVFFRTLFFLPTITQGAAIAIIWYALLNPNPSVGLVNKVIVNIGNLLNLPLKGPDWLGSVKWAKPALMLVMIWTYVGGYNMLLYLAALQNIPRELYEAAEVDGANGWQKFWSVTWPMITPTTFFITVMSIIGGFQGGFLLAYMMTGGGPAGSTTTIQFYIFNNLYHYQHVGYASAISWVLFIIVFVITLIYWKYGGKRVGYY